MRLYTLVLAALLSGCAQYENVRFNSTSPQQQALTRDGQSALVSRQKNSIVLVRSAHRQHQTGNRPVFVVGVNNITGKPIDFRVDNITATQVVNGQASSLKVITYDELVSEERTRQAIRAIGVGLAAAGNAMQAANAGRYSSTSTLYTPGGTYNVHTTGYSPTAAAIAQANASAQNEAMISATIERGQQNLAMLEAGVIKDNTLFPGEWYGGQLHLQPPMSEGGERKTYSVSFLVGHDRHNIEIVHEPTR